MTTEEVKKWLNFIIDNWLEIILCSIILSVGTSILFSAIEDIVLKFKK